jgi:hypothetical protein
MDTLEAIRARLMATHNRNRIRLFIDSRNHVIVSIPDDHVDPYGTINSMLLSRYANELTLYLCSRFDLNTGKLKVFQDSKKDTTATSKHWLFSYGPYVMEKIAQTETSLTLFLNFWPGLNTTSTTWIE